MMNILLGILKIIGILLAVLLGLLLLVFLILCFGPIGYGGKGTWQEEKQVGGYISWLGFVLRVRADYCMEAGLTWCIRLFGIIIASNAEEFIEKKEEKRRKKEVRKALKAKKKEKKTVESHKPRVEETVVTRQPDEKREDSFETKDKVKEIKKDVPSRNSLENGESKETVTTAFEPEPKEKKSFVSSIKDVFSGILEKGRSLLTKFKKFVEKIKAIPLKVKGMMTALREKIDLVLEIKEFIFGEKNRPGFHHVLKNGKKMVCHILPVKISGEVTFGVEDPYTMGQILTILGIFYPVYQDKFTLHPDFENSVFQGNAELKGRIIPGYLLWRVLVIIGSREVRRIIKEGRQLLRRK